MTAPLIIEKLLETDDPGICHIVCDFCLNKWKINGVGTLVAYCGYDCTDDEENEQNPNECVVCAELQFGPCPTCGRRG